MYLSYVMDFILSFFKFAMKGVNAMEVCVKKFMCVVLVNNSVMLYNF